MAAGGLADAGAGCPRPCRRRDRAGLRLFRTASSFAVYGFPSKTSAVWSTRFERICGVVVSRPTAGRRRRTGVGGGGVRRRSQEHAGCVSLTRAMRAARNRVTRGAPWAWGVGGVGPTGEPPRVPEVAALRQPRPAGGSGTRFGGRTAGELRIPLAGGWGMDIYWVGRAASGVGGRTWWKGPGWGWGRSGARVAELADALDSGSSE